ncbi:hypothetical protein SEUCBS140593_010306 [Sporothrix eucalyptigena]|uniref:Cyclohexanone monooxygenase n=1 Tax=Sporothrix eucalyptigena TaxID=1812306 RepID=A0ABP0D102_9PEZI
MASPDYDAIIVGAGFSGIRALWETLQQGLTVTCLEAGDDVGGVWYWNRYPGARTDSEGWVYSMNFSTGMQSLWNYGERYPSQTEVQQYIGRVADNFDLRKHVQFNMRVVSCHFDEATSLWTITKDGGKALTCRYFVAATGPLSIAKKLPFEGLASFEGDWYQTSSWPKDKVDFTGKRVAVVGTGATGVQIVPKIAATAKELVVFQRTPNFVLPGRNYVIDSDDAAAIRRKYNDTWNLASNHPFGLPMIPTGKALKDLQGDATAIRQMLDKSWEAGGFHMQFETFDDIFTDAESNAVVSEYLRDKIRAVVEDPATADALTPKYPFLSKRPPCGHFYYETFNRPNVKLVNIAGDSIDVDETGIKTIKAGNHYNVDVIVFALGFDAATGALCEMDVRGKGGISLTDKWNQKVETFAGALIPNFPNLFLICGPHIPFGNMPVVLDAKVQWIGKTLQYMKQNALATIDVKDEAVEAFLQDLQAAFQATLFAESAQKSGAWFVGANIPGKATGPLFYFGGVQSWVNWLSKESNGAYSSMVFSKA